MAMTAYRSEASLQATILRWLRSHGGWWVKFHVAGKYSTAGVPDIIGSYKGRFIAFEVKRPGGKPTPLQEATHKKMREQGKALVFVVDSLDKVKKLLYTLDRRERQTDDKGSA